MLETSYVDDFGWLVFDQKLRIHIIRWINYVFGSVGNFSLRTRLRIRKVDLIQIRWWLKETLKVRDIQGIKLSIHFLLKIKSFINQIR